MSVLPELASVAAAVASLYLHALQRSGAADGFAMQPRQESRAGWMEGLSRRLPAAALRPFAPHALACVWLLLVLAAQDDQAYLVAAVLLACSPGVPPPVLAAGLVLGVARRTAVGCGFLSILRSCWVPGLFLICSQLLQGSRPSARSESLVRRSPSAASDATSRTASLLKHHPQWSPPRMKEQQVYQWSFSVTDELLAVYPCAVSQQVLHHGHLYISDDHVSFQGVTIRGLCSLQFRFSFDDISDVRRGESSDSAALLLKSKVRLNSLERVEKLKGPQATDSTTSFDIEGCEDGLTVLVCILEQRGGSTSVGIDDDENNEDAETHASARPRSMSIAGNEMTALVDNEVPFTCLLEARVPKLLLPPLACDLLSETWGPETFLHSYFLESGWSNLQIGAWVDADPGAIMMREVKAVVPVPKAPMCPKSTKMTGNFIVCASNDLVGGGGGSDGMKGPLGAGPVSDPSSLTLLTSKASHDVPYGDCFLVQEKVELKASSSSSSEDPGVDLKISGRVVFLKSCMFQSKIKSGTISQLTSVAEAFLGHLRAHGSFAPGGASPRAVAKPPAAAGAPSGIPAQGEGGSPTEVAAAAAAAGGKPFEDELPVRTERVWELQRRSALRWGWHAPCGPGDMHKRWRWVDANYKPHALRNTTDREASAASDEPAVDAPPGWLPLEPWQSELRADTDWEGWQYAVDWEGWSWYRQAANPRLVRRRAWLRRYVEEKAFADWQRLLMLF